MQITILFKIRYLQKYRYVDEANVSGIAVAWHTSAIAKEFSMPEILRQPITDRSAWRGADLRHDNSWYWNLPDAAIHDIDATLANPKNSAVPLIEMTRDHLPLPSIARDIAALVQAFEDWEKPEDKRHLLRLWLNAPNGRKLAPAFADRYGTGTGMGVPPPSGAVQATMRL